MERFISSLIIASFLLASCASSSDNISATYVSPLQYQSYNCNQIRMEMQRVSRRVNEIAGVQDSHRTKDSVALGVGLVLFWPALFFMIGKDKEEELGRLKGEYEALEQVAIEKECNVAAEIEEARRMQDERKKSKKPQQEDERIND
ncbi:MAG: hypothetical protein ACE5EK_04055 [Nitrospinales bacterium]